MAQLNDIGVDFVMTIVDQAGVPVDVSSQTTLEICFRREDGSSFARDAEFVGDGTDGVVRYKSVSGDLDKKGTWEFQAHVILPGPPVEDFHSTIDTFEVEGNIC